MKARIEAFKSEWKMREALLKLEGLGFFAIERERKIMLNRYGLKEEEVERAG